MIEKLRIKQFCCCCDIRTGSLVIGVFGWVGSLLHAIALSAESTDKKIVTETEDEGIVEESTSNVGTILLSIFMFGMSVSLVFGVNGNNRNFILPWLVVKIFECIALTIITFIIFFALFVSEEVDFLFILFFIITPITVLFWYCWICVWSLYMDLGETTLTIVPMNQGVQMVDPSIQMQYTHDPNIQMQYTHYDPNNQNQYTHYDQYDQHIKSPQQQMV